jgi:DNA ligase-1
MLYRDLARLYERIEATPGRLDMATILAEFFRSTSAGELRKVVYLTQGKLHPDFFPKRLGVADKLLLKALAFTSGTREEEVNRLWLTEGDPGTVAEQVIASKKQTALFSEELTLERVYDTLLRMEEQEGGRSQDMRMRLLADILHDADPLEARYIARIVTGRMRLGVAAMTVVDALSQAFATRKEKDQVERAFNISSDLGEVAERLSKDGIEGLEGLLVRTGNPIRAMLAERLPSLTEILERMGGSTAFEYKYDGLRLQAHISGNGIRLFSRRLEDLTAQFPDVISGLVASFHGREAIVEGECVPVHPVTGEVLPFQEVSHRRGRKNMLEEAIREHPVRLLLFDCLLMDGEDLTESALPERRRRLEEGFATTDSIGLSEMRVLSDENEAFGFFEKAIQDGCEGVMAKSIDDASHYRAGARGFLWIKYKREYRSEMVDTVDLAVVGAYAGKGRRKGAYGALLMATYDDEGGVFETTCKLGTGFDDSMLAELPDILAPFEAEGIPKGVASKMVPDRWFSPGLVMEVLGAEITVSPVHTSSMANGAGLAIRFPRFTGRIREDKAATDATTSRELRAMYDRQRKRLNIVE